jgi:hypothetical protein
MSIHNIRLAGPWELHQEGSEPTRVRLPFELQATDNTCQLIRNFHRPSGLTDECQVRIVATTSITPLTVLINGKPVEPSAVSKEEQSCEATYDTTTLLKAFNSLSIQPTAGAALTVRAAAIEIESNDTSN